MSISYVLQVEKENNDSQPQSFHMLCDDSNLKPKLLTNVEAKLISHIPHTINSQAEHAMKPSVNVLLDSGNRCGHNLISSDAIKRLELKAVKRSPLNLRTFNNTEAEYDEEAIIRLSLPILRQDKEVYTCSYEFTCLVVQNLSVDVLISEKSIQELDLFARQFKLSAEDEAAIKLIKETGDPLKMTPAEETLDVAKSIFPSNYVGGITTVDEPPASIFPKRPINSSTHESQRSCHKRCATNARRS